MTIHRQNFLNTVYSYVFGRVIERVQGEINPILEIVHMNGKYILKTENANYSWGTLKEVFAKAFRKLEVKKRDIHDVLMLGYGTGSVASILLEEYKMSCSITGVEKDKKVIELAYEYYDINRNENLRIIHEDAFNFLKGNKNLYDLVIVDVYIDNIVPAKCESEEFLQYLKGSLKDKALVVFNKMYFDKETEDSAKKLYERFGHVMGNASYLKIHKHHTNLMIYHEHSMKDGEQRKFSGMADQKKII